MDNEQHRPRHAGTTPQQEALFREALDDATDAIGMATPQGCHYYQNHAFTELFGDIGDNPPVTLYADPVIGHQVFAVLKAGGRWDGEVRMNGRDGQILDIDLRAYAIMDEDGRIQALVGIHTDITDRKQVEDALVRLNAELEQRVAERTRLAEQRAEQLRHLAGRLAESEQAERRRIARVLHEDLQQILVGVQYQLHLLRAHDPARVADTEAQLQQALRVSSRLTTELSPTILYEEGLSAALPGLAAQMQTSYGLTVRTEIRTVRATDDDGTSVFLYHAARELLFNVVKHAGVQEASVTLDATADNRIRLTVDDQGAGFEPRRPPTSDQGFGLFEIRERTEHLGGVFSIDSAPGKGTRITLTL